MAKHSFRTAKRRCRTTKQLFPTAKPLFAISKQPFEVPDRGTMAALVFNTFFLLLRRLFRTLKWVQVINERVQTWWHLARQGLSRNHACSLPCLRWITLYWLRQLPEPIKDTKMLYSFGHKFKQSEEFGFHLQAKEDLSKKRSILMKESKGIN